MKKNKPNKTYVDDGHTIYSMDGITDTKPSKCDLGLTRKERRALKQAAFVAYLPYLLMILGSFTLAMILICFWL